MTTGLAPLFTVFDLGQAAPSSWVYAYRSGTTTPVTTYADALLTTPNPNPMVADADGQVSFYMTTADNLRLDLYTTGGIEEGAFLRTIDPVYPAAVASGGSGGRRRPSPAPPRPDLGSTGLFLIKVTGVTAVSSFGASASLTAPLYTVRFTDPLTLSYDAASMVLPGGADLAVAAGDALVAEYLGAGRWKVLLYQRATGRPVVGAGVRGGTYQVTDATDVALSTPGTHATVGPAFTADVPARGRVELQFSGQVVIATADNAVILGLRVAGNNYLPATSAGYQLAFAQTVGTSGNSAYGGLDSSAGAGSFVTGFSVEASSLPAGTQSLQVVAFKRSGSGSVTLKGTAQTTAVNVTFFDHT